MKFIPGMKGNKSSSKFLLLVLTISIVFGSLFLITSALGVKYTYSNQLWDGTAKSSCSTCGMLSSDQFTYGSNWGTWYVSQNSIFPIQLKVNDMLNPTSYGNDYKAYKIVLVDMSNSQEIVTFNGWFPTSEYVESQDVYYNYTVAKEGSVKAVVTLQQYNGVWVESYYYLTGTSPTWTFKYQPTSVADIDKDGKPDPDDLCPNNPETVNGYLDADGCPDTVPTATPSSSSGGGTTTTTIIPTNTTTPSGSSTSPTGNTVTEPDNTDDGNDVSGGGASNDPAPTYDMFEGSCSEWANNSLLGLGEYFPGVLGPFTFILTVLCWVSKAVTFAMFLPFIILANFYYAFVNVLCIGQFGFLGGTIPIVLSFAFLFLLLVPDDVIGGIGGWAMTFFLGTTAPLGAVASVPFIASIASIAVPAFITSGAVVSTVNLGPKAIVIGLIVLCLYQILVGQGSLLGSVVRPTKYGGDKTDITIINDVVAGGNQLSGLKTVVAEMLLITLALCYIECKLGIPIYTGVLSLITAIPDILNSLGALF